MVRTLAAVLAEDLKDTSPTMITFTRAEITKDLKQAKVYFSAYGNDDAVEKSFEFLKRHAGVIRRMVGNRMRIKHNPELTFVYDDTTDHVLRVGEILNRIKKDDDSGTDK